MNASQQHNVTVPPYALELAARLAKAMTADPDATASGESWSVQDVIEAALRRGLTEMERIYLGGQS